jgi:hypothetical protein
MNIVLGIAGAALANWLLSLFGVGLGGWLGYLITSFIGACKACGAESVGIGLPSRFALTNKECDTRALQVYLRQKTSIQRPTELSVVGKSRN